MSETKPRPALNITLWVLQALLGLMYAFSGFQKGFGDLNEVVKTVFWIAYTPVPLVRFIGVSELLGGIGLILPALLRIRPQLTTLAAAGLSTIMILANIMHAVRGEFFVLPMTLVMAALLVFVTYGRWKLAPIVPKA